MSVRARILQALEVLDNALKETDVDLENALAEIERNNLAVRRWHRTGGWSVDNLYQHGFGDSLLLAFKDWESKVVVDNEEPEIEEPEDPTMVEAYPNEPTGFNKITEHNFNTLSEDGWRAINDPNKLTLVQDAGEMVGRVKYPAGDSGGRSPAWLERVIKDEGVHSLYTSFRVKVSENWQGHPSRVNKIGFMWTHNKPVAFPALLGADDDVLQGVMYLQDTPDGSHRLEPNLGDLEIVRGKWYRWEVLLMSNTNDTPNGQVHFWIDGKKLGEYRNLRFSSRDQNKIWENLAWRPIWGGIGGTIREDMYMYMSHYYASGT